MLADDPSVSDHDAADGHGDRCYVHKLCRRPISFDRVLFLTTEQLMFTCPCEGDLITHSCRLPYKPTAWAHLIAPFRVQLPYSASDQRQLPNMTVDGPSYRFSSMLKHIESPHDFEEWCIEYRRVHGRGSE